MVDGGGKNSQVHRWGNTIDWSQVKKNCCHNVVPFRDGLEPGSILYNGSQIGAWELSCTRGGLYQTPCVDHFRSSWVLSSISSFNPYCNNQLCMSFYWLHINAILQHLSLCLHLEPLVSCPSIFFSSRLGILQGPAWHPHLWSQKCGQIMFHGENLREERNQWINVFPFPPDGRSWDVIYAVSQRTTPWNQSVMCSRGALSSPG